MSKSQTDSKTRRSTSGFTLIEVLVAFALLAGSLAVIVQVFGTATHARDAAHDRSMALAIAEAQIARAVVTTETGEYEETGSIGTTHGWRLRVRRLQERAGDQEEQVVPLAYSVVVTVLWPAQEPRNEVTLTTLRLTPPS